MEGLSLEASPCGWISTWCVRHTPAKDLHSLAPGGEALGGPPGRARDGPTSFGTGCGLGSAPTPGTPPRPSLSVSHGSVQYTPSLSSPEGVRGPSCWELDLGRLPSATLALLTPAGVEPQGSFYHFVGMCLWGQGGPPAAGGCLARAELAESGPRGVSSGPPPWEHPRGPGLAVWLGFWCQVCHCGNSSYSSTVGGPLAKSSWVWGGPALPEVLAQCRGPVCKRHRGFTVPWSWQDRPWLGELWGPRLHCAARLWVCVWGCPAVVPPHPC